MATRTVDIPGSESVQDVVLTDLGKRPFKTLEVVKLDNTDELWLGLANRAFTAADEDDVDVVPDGAQYGVFDVETGGKPFVTVDSGDDVTIPVLYVTGGRVQFRIID